MLRSNGHGGAVHGVTTVRAWVNDHVWRNLKCNNKLSFSRNIESIKFIVCCLYLSMLPTGCDTRKTGTLMLSLIISNRKWTLKSWYWSVMKVSRSIVMQISIHLPHNLTHNVLQIGNLLPSNGDSAAAEINSCDLFSCIRLLFARFPDKNHVLFFFCDSNNAQIYLLEAAGTWLLNCTQMQRRPTVICTTFFKLHLNKTLWLLSPYLTTADRRSRRFLGVT